MDKPRLSYTRIYLPVKKGEETLVDVLNSQGKPELRYTSPVIDLIQRINDQRPVFETMNTIYVPTD